MHYYQFVAHICHSLLHSMMHFFILFFVIYIHPHYNAYNSLISLKILSNDTTHYLQSLLLKHVLQLVETCTDTAQNGHQGPRPSLKELNKKKLVISGWVRLCLLIQED